MRTLGRCTALCFGLLGVVLTTACGSAGPSDAETDAALDGSVAEADASQDASPGAAPPESLRKLLRLPEHFQEPYIPPENPLTQAKVKLGRFLFYDTRLSGNETQSCGSCHEQERGFAEDRATSIGSTEEVLVRNSQGLANVAYFSSLTWASDGLLHLENQLKVPITNDRPIELGVTDGIRDEVLQRFEQDEGYARLFREAFPESDSGVTLNKVIFAIASFVRTMVSGDSPYDRYLQGDKSALTKQEQRGLSAFNLEVFECHHCHGGTLQTKAYRDANTQDDSDAALAFFNNGLYNVDFLGGYPEYDQGLYDLTLDKRDRGLFRPPSLRNVAVTAPYMHDGSIETLREVVEHYASGGRMIEQGPLAGDGRVSPLKSGLVKPFAATDEEIDAVVAFLEALTDESFLTDPAFSDPGRP